MADATSAFQVRAAATGNARSPSVVRRVDGTGCVHVDPERRRQRDSTLDIRRTIMMTHYCEGSGRQEHIDDT